MPLLEIHIGLEIIARLSQYKNTILNREVTPLTQSALSKKKLIKNKYCICITNKTLTITFYSLSPWNKNLSNSQEAQNAIAPTSRTINNADSVC